jgi:hypothetical protein
MRRRKDETKAEEVLSGWKFNKDRAAILSLFSENPEMLDPVWEEKNPRHPYASRARFLRWSFCIQLHRGDFKYRLPRRQELDSSVTKGKSWPSDENEKILFNKLMGTNDPTQAAILPESDPWDSILKTLVPSALKAFADGNRKAVMILGREMPGLLMVRASSPKGDIIDDEFHRYLKHISEFQARFMDLLRNREVRTTDEPRHPSAMKKRSFDVERYIGSGLDRDVVYAVLRHEGKEFTNIAVERHQVRKKIREKEDRWFVGGAKLERSCREAGLVPSKLTFCLALANWVIVQRDFRQKIQGLYDKIYNMQGHALKEDKDSLKLLVSIKKYMVDHQVISVPMPEELVENAKNWWPGLRDRTPGYDAIETARDLLKVFKKIYDWNLDESCFNPDGILGEVALRYAELGISEASRYLEEIRCRADTIAADKQLRETYMKAWGDLTQAIPRNEGYSYPLLVATTPGYFSSSVIKLLVVGQQTNGWHGIFDEKCNDKAIDELMALYRKFNSGESCKKSLIMKAGQELQSKINPGSDRSGFMWSNIVRLDRAGKRPSAIESVLSKIPWLFQEISILKPDVIVFFTGTDYDDRLITTFPGIALTAVPGFPSSMLSRLKHPSLPERTFRTYHPNHLARKKKLGAIMSSLAKIVLARNSCTGKSK